jgi:bifunctional non-homologous end joining protein LigD
MGGTLARVGIRDVHVDAKMNGHGQQVVAPYSIRPVPTAAVATPLAWNEVGAGLDPAAFDPQVVRERVGALGDLAAPLLRGRRSLKRLV